MGTAADTLIEAARRTQEWARERPLIIDVAFAGLVAVISLADLVSTELSLGAREADVVGVALVLGGAALLIWRRSSPVLVLAAATVVMGTFYVLDYGSFMSAVGLSAIYAVTAHERNRRVAWSSVALSSAALVAMAGFTILNGEDGFRFSNTISMIVFLGVAAASGAMVRNRQQIFVNTQARAERAEADRVVEAERAVARERLRIAREMHDVVAHGMSVMAVQAAAAQEITRDDPDGAIELMHNIETTGREALNEMRRMLGVLRHNDGTSPARTSGELSPQPSLSSVDATIAQCVEAGVPTELVVTGEARTLSPGLELAAFRIIQEALTNVLKHGGRSAQATVGLDYTPTVLRITIGDTGRGAATNLTDLGSGNGLIGMRERVDLYGGDLTAGPRPGGGYEVTAMLPTEATHTRPKVASADQPKEDRFA